MTYVDPSGVETPGIELKCHWNGAWLGPRPGTCEWRFCPDPPNPPAEHNMVLVGYNGIPVRIGQEWLFRCKDGMRFEDDIQQSEFRARCVAGNSFEPLDFTSWPKCKPTSTCNPLPSIAPGGNATKKDGLALGPCLGYGPDGTKFVKPPSCPNDVTIKPYYGVGYRVLATSERFAQDFRFRQKYPESETRNISYLITTSYPFQLENLYTGQFDSDEPMPHSGDPHRPHQRLLKRQNAPGGGDLRFGFVC